MPNVQNFWLYISWKPKTSFDDFFMADMIDRFDSTVLAAQVASQRRYQSKGWMRMWVKIERLLEAALLVGILTGETRMG